MATAARIRRRRMRLAAAVVLGSLVAGLALGLTLGYPAGPTTVSGTVPSRPAPQAAASGSTATGSADSGSADSGSAASGATASRSEPGTSESGSENPRGAPAAGPPRSPPVGRGRVAVVQGHTPTSPGPDDLVTPSGNILCSFGDGVLDCQIGSGLVPVPEGPCPLAGERWSGIGLPSSGDAEPWCTATRIEDRRAPERALAYGEVWERDGIVCTSGRDGLHCRNRDGAGMSLSRARSSYLPTTGPPAGR